MKIFHLLALFIVGATANVVLRKDSGCECDTFISANGWGNCLKQETDGKTMCYIKNPDTSTCSDKVASGTNPGKSWSYVACNPTPTPTNEKYFLARKGGLCSEIKTVTFSEVKTLKECKIAVAVIKKTVPAAKFQAEEKEAGWPKGCYLYIITNGVYFNTDSAGKAHDSARQICEDAVTGTCKGDNDCGGKDSKEKCKDGLCVCGDPAKAGAQSTCVGNPGAPTCDADNKACKCGTKASCMGSTTKKSAPICFKKGKELACACGDQGICKDGSVCTKDANGKPQCTVLQLCPTPCPKNEKCDTFHQVCRCGDRPSCANFQKGQDCVLSSTGVGTCKCGSADSCIATKLCDPSTKTCYVK